MATEADRAGMSRDRRKDLVLAANEIATNSLRHGGGMGTLRSWTDDGSMICEIHDRGVIADPLVGRRRPSPSEDGGRGIWLANQLCDLVQIRAHDRGNVVRLHLRTG
jgi:anti-sigma regulatory factor (Ser/Thr protein kinase)